MRKQQSPHEIYGEACARKRSGARLCRAGMAESLGGEETFQPILSWAQGLVKARRFFLLESSWKADGSHLF